MVSGLPSLFSTLKLIAKNPFAIPKLKFPLVKKLPDGSLRRKSMLISIPSCLNISFAFISRSIFFPLAPGDKPFVDERPPGIECASLPDLIASEPKIARVIGSFSQVNSEMISPFPRLFPPPSDPVPDALVLLKLFIFINTSKPAAIETTIEVVAKIIITRVRTLFCCRLPCCIFFLMLRVLFVLDYFNCIFFTVVDYI